MFKKGLLIGCFCLGLVINLGSVMAKSKECIVKPTYNIVVTQDYAEIINDESVLKITKSGIVTLNDVTQKLKPSIKKEAIQFEQYLSKELPALANQADDVLAELRSAFTEAIIANLGDDSKLIGSVNNLYTELLNLLHKSIVTKDNITYFYYEPFNTFKADSEAVSKKMMYQVLGDSIFSFSIFKNYSTIKQISKQEWKEQKVYLNDFQDDACNLVTEIDNRYNHFMIGLNY